LFYGTLIVISKVIGTEWLLEGDCTLPFEHFARLDDNKKRDILNAALEEFVQYGYDLASTNRMVERAGIAKGALFKYFSTKEALFLFLCEQCSEEVAQVVTEASPESEQDFFGTLKAMAVKEIILSMEKPELFTLFQHMANHPEHPVYKQALQKDHEKSREMSYYLVTALARNPLQQDVSLERVLLVVTWVLEGLKQKILITSQMNNREQWIKEVQNEVDATLGLLKYGIIAKKDQ
jgi:TetR/AcrR family transcriptional regulator